MTVGVGEPAPTYVGVNEEEARSLAESEGLELRVVGRDGICAPATADFREGRVNLDIVDGVVIRAERY